MGREREREREKRVGVGVVSATNSLQRLLFSFYFFLSLLRLMCRCRITFLVFWKAKCYSRSRLREKNMSSPPSLSLPGNLFPFVWILLFSAVCLCSEHPCSHSFPLSTSPLTFLPSPLLRNLFFPYSPYFAIILSRNNISFVLLLFFLLSNFVILKKNIDSMSIFSEKKIGKK